MLIRKIEIRTCCKFLVMNINKKIIKGYTVVAKSEFWQLEELNKHLHSKFKITPVLKDSFPKVSVSFQKKKQSSEVEPAKSNGKD